MNPKFALIFAISMTLALLLSPLAMANEQDKKTIAKRMQDRYAQVLQLKQTGKIGENIQGMIEAVKAEYAREEAVSQVLNGENSDRQALYAIIAQEQKTTPQAVARAAAERNFRIARTGDWLKGADGQWTQKK